jgi:hypothetical protein
LQIFLKNKKKTPQVILFGKFDKQKDSWRHGIMENNQEKLPLGWLSAFKTISNRCKFV